MHIKDQFNLSEKVAIVTGSSKGIGKAMAKGLAQLGAKVVVSSRKQEAVDAVAKEFEAENLEVAPIACHVGDEEQRKHLVQKTIEHFGGVDILINNAATNPFFGPLESASNEIFDKLVNINIKAPWALSNLVLESMKKRKGGSIINVSSVEGIHPGFGLGLYGMTKAALIMVTKNQAKEWGQYGVRSNVICPGLVKTKFSAAIWQNENVLKEFESKLPSGRMAAPEEMVGLVTVLASDSGSYMTGGVYEVDGGYLISG